MKAFELAPDMLTLAGVFYPTGYVFAMFPTEADARGVGTALEREHLSKQPIMLLSPQAILEQVVRTVGSADIPLPSAGTEAATVRQYAALAGQGHWAVMAHAPDADDTETVMRVVRQAPFSFAEKYRRLVIEDLA
ncbi:RNA-binding protein [Pseudorhodoferax sp.]|uniref:RNA-binding protein n=1 Tax=Pseudorhodoferax sp. TaxID=1993553 RepID=UPI002DD653D3|nr:RNA-binding protein [Pseudorhodoferax sp.]